MSSQSPKSHSSEPHAAREGVLRTALVKISGLLLSLVCVVAILFGIVTGELGLAIHPRYFVFAAVMAVIALVFIVGGIILAIKDSRAGMPSLAGHSHANSHNQTEHTDHSGHTADTNHTDHTDHFNPAEQLTGPRRSLFTAIGAGALIAVASLLLVGLGPQVLSPQSALIRADDSGSGPVRDASGDSGEDLVAFASELRGGGDAESLLGTEATISGFITADPASDDTVLVTRFVLTCCVVDAQPVTLAVSVPDWEASYQPGDWVEVTGVFRLNPSPSSSSDIALIPSDFTPIEEPAEPYVY
ncbi:hypothetical protein [Humidisolicoccus flavus]|uniref:TIGR03943 family putative permease subunit n=1 Tax=Humidisolicoccus flavus TaxID=3111414 RepID=UPI0032491DED